MATANFTTLFQKQIPVFKANSRDVIRIPGTTVAASPVFPPYFFVFFVGWFF